MKEHVTWVNPVMYLPFNVITAGDGYTNEHKQRSNWSLKSEGTMMKDTLGNTCEYC